VLDTMGNMAISTHTKMRDGISNPKIEPLLMGTDEEPAAKALHDLGVRGLVVAREAGRVIVKLQGK